MQESFKWNEEFIVILLPQELVESLAGFRLSAVRSMHSVSSKVVTRRRIDLQVRYNCAAVFR
jgi:hypothetical protein